MACSSTSLEGAEKLKSFASSRGRAVLFAILIGPSAFVGGVRPVAAPAGFTYSSSNPLVNQTITFTGSCFLPPCEYGWSFSDGTRGYGSPITHAYSAAGSYSVRVTAIDSYGNIAGSQTQTVTVAGVWIVGHVRDNSLATIAGATVKMYSQDGNTLLQTTTTDSSGYYKIGWRTSGTFMLWASKFNYWEEKLYVNVCCLDSTGTGDFRLPQDLYVPVANLLVMYASVNTQQTKADLSWTLSAGSKTHVDAYANSLGGSFDVSNDVTASGSASTGTNPATRSLLYQRGVIVHGVFWQQDPTHPINVYVLAQQDVYWQVNDMADYMVSPPSSSGSLDVPTRGSIQYTYTQSQSTALRPELGVNVSVSLEGIGLSTKLASLLVQGTAGVQRSTTIKITNLDSQTHSYYFYFEGGGVLHVWQTA